MPEIWLYCSGFACFKTWCHACVGVFSPLLNKKEEEEKEEEGQGQARSRFIYFSSSLSLYRHDQAGGLNSLSRGRLLMQAKDIHIQSTSESICRAENSVQVDAQVTMPHSYTPLFRLLTRRHAISKNAVHTALELVCVNSLQKRGDLYTSYVLRA